MRGEDKVRLTVGKEKLTGDHRTSEFGGRVRLSIDMIRVRDIDGAVHVFESSTKGIGKDVEPAVQFYAAKWGVLILSWRSKSNN